MYVQNICTFLYNIFISNALNIWDSQPVFGTVNSDTTVVVLLHLHFSSWLSILFNSISINTNCT